MKNTRFLMIYLMVLCIISCTQPKILPESFIIEEMEFALAQYKLMSAALPDYESYPRATADDGTLHLCKSDWWTSGFYPGSLWFLYEFSRDSLLLMDAEARTLPLAKEANNKSTHDLGFMLFNSFGNGYRLTKNPYYKSVLLEGVQSLVSRFNPKIGCIQSWDANEKWDFPVIIDNMMNLEYLFWATRETGDSSFYRIAVSHTDKTLENHFRPDHSSYHVVAYDTVNGHVTTRQTHQGYADDSAWARGQAWGLYGYTMVYRETGDPRYLEQARSIADYLLDHPNLPEDYIFYWDLDGPNIPDEERDASAAAIICSALVELSEYCGKEDRDRYLAVAERILTSLASPNYRAYLGENNNFILKHSVGAKPFGGEVDVPLIYADYYYIEALLRYYKLNYAQT